jgi:valyl-tRNA synthetase
MAFKTLLVELGRLESIQFTSDDEIPESATALVGSLTVLVPLGAVIDRNAELARLTREIDKLKKDLQRTEGKLANRSFVDKAPVEIVSREQDRAHSMAHSIAQLEAQQRRVEGI